MWVFCSVAITLLQSSCWNLYRMYAGMYTPLPVTQHHHSMSCPHYIARRGTARRGTRAG